MCVCAKVKTELLLFDCYSVTSHFQVIAAIIISIDKTIEKYSLFFDTFISLMI